ncbi:hypothetical protein ACFWZ3_08745 [Frateuria sp. GZRR35]|uniref:hypothetical protein n=1 Tax=unclassified Frateuria TaxID=2648894 RepID=UPI003EDBD66C
MSKFSFRRVLCAGMVSMGLAATTLSAAPLNNGLGQAWPNAQDVSANAHWHVYVFANNGIRYVQVNDAYGNVRAAVGAVGGQFLVLPMGRDAQRISTPQQALPAGSTAVPLTSYTETVYKDDSMQLDAVPMSDGTTVFSVAPMTTNALVAPCDNPAECNGHLN